MQYSALILNEPVGHKVPKANVVFLYFAFVN